MKKILFVIFALFSFSGLMAKKPPFSLTFGSSGGFTGLTTTYKVNSDRTFSKEESLSHTKEQLPKVKHKDIKQIRKLLADVNFSILNINKSGNINSFVTLSENGKEYHTQWTGNTSDNLYLDELHKKLISLIPHK
jgi:hypothetical protein